jgi:hypothetical protein
VIRSPFLEVGLYGVRPCVSRIKPVPDSPARHHLPAKTGSNERRCPPSRGGQALATPCGVLLHTPQSSLLGALQVIRNSSKPVSHTHCRKMQGKAEGQPSSIFQICLPSDLLRIASGKRTGVTSYNCSLSLVTCPPKTGPDFEVVFWHNLGQFLGGRSRELEGFSFSKRRLYRKLILPSRSTSRNVRKMRVKCRPSRYLLWTFGSARLFIRFGYMWKRLSSLCCDSGKISATANSGVALAFPPKRQIVQCQDATTVYLRSTITSSIGSLRSIRLFDRMWGVFSEGLWYGKGISRCSIEQGRPLSHAPYAPGFHFYG